MKEIQDAELKIIADLLKAIQDAPSDAIRTARITDYAKFVDAVSARRGTYGLGFHGQV